MHWGVLVVLVSGAALAQTTPPPDLHVTDDGTVHIDLARSFELELVTPAKAIENLRRGLAEWILDPQAYSEKLMTSGEKWSEARAGVFQIKHVVSGTLVEPDDKHAQDLMIYMPLLAGHFGGGSSALAKQRYLDATRDQRMTMATEERERLGTEAVYHMSSRLEALWVDGRPAAAHRADLYRLWDECNASRYGLEARATVIGFIRRRLPRGSPDAYPPDELERLNIGRTQSERFDPYGR